MKRAIRGMMAALAIAAGGGMSAGGATLRGVVVAEDGQPTAGARVWAALLWADHLDRREGRADEGGRFAIDLPAGTKWVVAANLGDLGPAEVYQAVEVADRDPAPVTVQLKPQGHLRGRLVEAETGRPIVGGRFVLDTGLDPTTDADGRFEVAGLGRERYHEAFVVAAGRERKRVLFEMADAPTTDLVVAIPRGAKAVGRVLDPAGRPIAGAAVGRAVSGMSISITALWTHSDAAGRYEYDGLPLDRTTTIDIHAAGYRANQRSNVRANLDGSPLALDFRLFPLDPDVQRQAQAADPLAVSMPFQAPPARSRRDVTGVVVDLEKRPVAAQVRWGAGGTTDTIEAQADAAGRFRLARVPDQPGIVVVIPGRDDLAPEVADVAEGGDREITIVLPRGRVAEGAVHDDRGAPFTGVTVLPTLAEVGDRGLPLWERSVRTDAQGHFRVAGLPDTPASFDFLGAEITELRRQTLALDRPNDVVLAAAGVVAGRVVDPAGRPVRNFRVLLNGSKERKADDKFGGFFAGFCGTGLSFTTDDGRFLVRGLGLGSVQRVTVLAPGYAEATVDRVLARPANQAGGDQVPTFRLGPPHILRVHAFDRESKRPVAAARVGLIYDPSVGDNFQWGYSDTFWGDSTHARTNAAGVATFDPLSFAEGIVTVQVPGFARCHVPWDGAAVDLAVPLTPEASVAGSIVDTGTGQPLTGIAVRLESPTNGRIGIPLYAEDAGQFRFGELPEGNYTLTVIRGDGTNLHREALPLAAGEGITRALRLDPARAGAPVPDVDLPAAPGNAAEPVVPVGAVAPDFAAATPGGDPFALRDFRGKYVLLDFWATWCGPCVAEIPHLRAVHDAFGADPRFALVSLSVDASAADLAAFLKDHPEPWTQVALGDWTKDPVTKSYGVAAIPSIWLIDPAGKVVARDLRGANIKAAVARALKRD